MDEMGEKSLHFASLDNTAGEKYTKIRKKSMLTWIGDVS